MTTEPVPAAQYSAAPQTDPVLVTLGDIAVSQHWVVTPAGTVPTAGSQFFVADHTRIEKYPPGWAIALAIVGFLFFFLGLLFLLVRSTRVSGAFQYTVTNGPFTYQSFEPASPNIAQQNVDAMNRTNFARNLAFSAAQG